jgi:hypothetical protein
MSFWSDRKNRKNAKLAQDIREERQEIKQKIDEDATIKKTIQNFGSFRNLIRKSLPQIIMGLVVVFLEYITIGFAYTIVSLVVLMPITYFYTKSLRPKRGKYLLEVNVGNPEDKSPGATEITRYLIPIEIWDLIKWEAPLVPGSIRMNGEEVFLATKTWKIEGTNLIYKVKLAWFHFNQLEYARNKRILERAIAFATQLSLENAELEKLKEFLSVVEGKRQTRERLELIDKAYRENPSELKNEIRIAQEKIDQLTRSNKDLLYGPDEKKEESESEIQN